ncbi:polysaccharide deacetylase family protein (PEP-CTERM system associated) [Chromatocurvus halotolerans]|uniref:Polysaccharide deacetylase family protein (PEP-CTERM system associated) n=2 Tax=Chromatocurvus halotolerans TaxID=1132028 RepID=A0A4R2KLN7_9GAMM|nr:polysaccharide deacetylase family protein (PEP-CTERM system associated) [Chromatocurvus halotolerans]
MKRMNPMDHPMKTSAPRLNAMTVDVEDYFQVSAFEQHVGRAEWDTRPRRVAANMDRILELFDQHGVNATFFTLGWVAEREPTMVRRIVDAGHELASHGWQHTRANTQSPQDFADDIRRTRTLLEDLGGCAVLGYRAASYSIGADNLWAHDALADAGYHYSSSIVPISHDLYGMPEAPRFAFSAADGRLTEIPVTTLALPGRNINCGGGGWFRLYPYVVSRWALRHINNVEGQSGLFYFHPWEIDPEQPRPQGLPLKTRFRHYLNLSRMHSRIESLLTDFAWDRMDRVFATQIRGSQRGQVPLGPDPTGANP